ncbi:hypothetical protein SJAG_03378 [Schizosaccharomyces japonicus yFS275]|uniref:Uncharacterized protein n=1 Tax=Schizosaccharomyces japonicus (strain yFS275 / FY16936) TaxID=402676 RepID=B6K429_SCHJY|nr:hypothetical protein SJAG_03378 [Schizosaccharomyces japonicus yFS275]EEB08236.1 hypothetical protein SJAG_03378 [Schizosaccharomyces japonicus yFS275]
MDDFKSLLEALDCSEKEATDGWGIDFVNTPAWTKTLISSDLTPELTSESAAWKNEIQRQDPIDECSINNSLTRIFGPYKMPSQLIRGIGNYNELTDSTMNVFCRLFAPFNQNKTIQQLRTGALTKLFREHMLSWGQEHFFEKSQNTAVFCWSSSYKSELKRARRSLRRQRSKNSIQPTSPDKAHAITPTTAFSPEDENFTSIRRNKSILNQITQNEKLDTANYQESEHNKQLQTDFDTQRSPVSHPEEDDQSAKAKTNSKKPSSSDSILKHTVDAVNDFLSNTISLADSATNDDEHNLHMQKQSETFPTNARPETLDQDLHLPVQRPEENVNAECNVSVNSDDDWGDWKQAQDDSNGSPEPQSVDTPKQNENNGLGRSLDFSNFDLSVLEKGTSSRSVSAERTIPNNNESEAVDSVLKQLPDLSYLL